MADSGTDAHSSDVRECMPLPLETISAKEANDYFNR